MSDHLNALVRDYVDLPYTEREKLIKSDRWIGYEAAQNAINKLEELLGYPRSIRMPSMLLVGDPGNGKSTILERFHNRYPIDKSANGRAIVPVLRLDMGTQPEESRFWSDILMKFQIAHRDTERVQSLKKEALGIMMESDTRLLIVDEFHNVLYGSPKKQRQFLAVLKNLSNDLRLPTVCAGTRESILVMHTDPQLSSRFEAFGLPNWKLNKNFLTLLAGFEALIPLGKPSGLTSSKLAPKLHSMSQGSIGALSKILEKAAIKAIKTSEECITPEILDGINWVKVSDYNEQTRL